MTNNSNFLALSTILLAISTAGTFGCMADFDLDGEDSDFQPGDSGDVMLGENGAPQVEEVGSSNQALTVNASFSEGFETNAPGWTVPGTVPWYLGFAAHCPGHSSTSRFVYFMPGNCNYATGARVDTALFSPVISNLPADAELGFSFVRQVEYYTGGSYDRTTVDVSPDGGSNWYTVWSRDSTNPSLSAWQNETVSLAAFAGADIQLRFAFDSVDGAVNNYLGWFIDDVEIIAPDLSYTWDGSCTNSQVGANGSVTVTKTAVGGGLYDVVMEGDMSIYSPTYGYVRHGMLPGLRPVSSDPQAYTCEIQVHDIHGDTSGVNNYGGNGVHIRPDTFGGYTTSATIWFPEKFYNGNFTLRCTWQTNEADNMAILQACPGVTIQ